MGRESSRTSPHVWGSVKLPEMQEIIERKGTEKKNSLPTVPIYMDVHFSAKTFPTRIN